MGNLHDKSTVKLDPKQGLTVFVVNCVLPGWGTLTSGMMCKEVRCNNICLGIIQMFLSLIIIGWLWSIWTGYMIWYRSIS